MRCLVLLALLAQGATASADAQPTHGPVLVELFTSQGCSSCPPADEVLAELADRKDVVALSFHVDYWDDLGWSDPFSSPNWSARQRHYGGRIFTPELIVGGQTSVVGSRRAEANRAIRAALAQPPAGHVDASYAIRANQIEVRASATGADGDIIAVLFQDQARTRVTRGENRGRTLASRHIVHSLTRIGTVRDGRGRARATIRSPLADSRVAVFVQSPDTHAVSAATLARRCTATASTPAGRPAEPRLTICP